MYIKMCVCLILELLYIGSTANRTNCTYRPEVYIHKFLPKPYFSMDNPANAS